MQQSTLRERLVVAAKAARQNVPRGYRQVGNLQMLPWRRWKRLARKGFIRV